VPVKRFILITALAIVASFTFGGGRAHAYPQFQLSRDQTCSSCHLGPEGGGLLNENGDVFAENNSQYGQSGAFFYDKFKLPSWLTLGGDLRGAYGYDRTPQQYLVAFPMQLDLYASAKFAKHFRFTVTAGYRPPEVGNEAATYVWSREHYLLWSQDPDGVKGWFVRIGRFMPIFGLRYAEHPTFTRSYGGTPLYSETYGAAVEYVDDKYEAHLTGFLKDPVIDPVAHDNGVALYAEYRLQPNVSIGVEGMATRSDDDRKFRGGVTAKYYLKGPDLLLMFEGQVVDQRISHDYGAELQQLVGEVTATKFLPMGMWLDVGLGHFDEDLRIAGLDRDALDVNLHWLTTSHFELLLTTRLELINQGRTQPNGNGPAPTGGYALLQAHYRL
jgi:hypothetical protein